MTGANEEMAQRLKAIAQEIERGPFELPINELLYGILEEVQDELINLAFRLSSKLFGLVWFLKVSFIDGLLENSTIEEKGIPQEQGRPLLDKIMKNTGQLINEVLTGSGKAADLMGEITWLRYKLIKICENEDPDIDRMHL